MPNACSGFVRKDNLEMQPLTIGHSPDADDAFIFYALTHGKIDTRPYRFQHQLQDIETLNQRALREELDVSAVSVHAYAYLTDRYVLLPCGASIGKGYGPIVVTLRPTSIEGLVGKKFAVPGERTTAFLVLKLMLGPVDYEVVPFDETLEAVLSGKADAGLVIHEGQITYRDQRLYKAVDLGQWWLEETGLPLPLGANVARRALGTAVLADLARLLRESIDYALTHWEEALDYALGWGRGLDLERADRFVQMYVNHYTQEWGQEGRQALETLLERAYQAGILPMLPKIEFAGDEVR
jgi:1,4-dihydroxy-6-naphthoate synthase